MYALVFKRCFDVLLSALALTLLSPILALVALLVRLEDGGPAVFRQVRVGRDGRRFTIYKFRSMPVATPHLPSAAAATLKVTRVGQMIRRTNLDELPQLFNILKGDMSLIGPRPALPTQWRLLALRERDRVLSIRPGLTGLAQVNAYDGMPEEEKVEWERRYVRRITLLGDMRIIARTFVYVLSPPPVY